MRSDDNLVEVRARGGFQMLQFDDPRWDSLSGGYRIPYDPRPALRAWERGSDDDAAWKELWNELHHQGDVGEASYAAVPHLIRIHRERGIPDWNAYALAATVEQARHSEQNPVLPAWLEAGYRRAWLDILEAGLAELAVVALSIIKESFSKADSIESGIVSNENLISAFASAFRDLPSRILLDEPRLIVST